MKEKTRKLITIISLAVALLSCIFAVMFAIGHKTGEFDGMFDITFWVLVIIVAATLIAWIFFALKQLIKNFKEDPKKAKKTIFIAIALIVACILSYVFASGTDVSDVVLDKYHVTTGTSKLIGAGCILVYILTFAAVLSIIYVECAKLFKKK